MSHVDDGTLHAYLDGELPSAEVRGIDAHLAQCPECRTRLEEERALIARADELLGRAAPPDRALPPFRPGDVRPARLWWRVRLPLTWAATIALAVGAGWYLGTGGVAVRPPQPAANVLVDSAAGKSVTPPAVSPAPQAARVREPPPHLAAAPPSQVVVGVAAPVEQPSVALAQHATPESLVAASGAARRAVAVPAQRSLASQDAAEALPPPSAPISLDSARALLGGDPVALPDVPIRVVRHEPALGYAVVVIEQQLDTTTVLRLVERRDFTARVARRAKAADERYAAPPEGVPAIRVGGIRVEIAAPLPADSLRQLLGRLKPLAP